MKKFFVVMIALVLSIAFTATAFAGARTICADGTLASNCGWQSTSFGGGEYRPSAKVVLQADTTNIAYCAASQHTGSAGNVDAGKQYATLSSSPQILSAAPVANGPSACGSATALPTGTWN